MIFRLSVVFLIIILNSTVFVNEIKAQESKTNTKLDEIFKSYEIMNIDSRSFYNTVKSSRNGSAVKLKISETTEWNLILENSGIIDSDYFVTESTKNGLVRKSGTTALPMQGYVVGHPKSRVSITFNHDFIYGFITLGNTTYFIEPLNHFVQEENDDKFVLYSVNDIIPGEEKVCGYDAYLKEKESNRTKILNNSGARMPGQCLRVEIALAADFLMHQAYGNSTGVQNHNIGVLNNVQTNYDDEFADELQFALTEQWISTCSSCDPWTSSADAGDLLDDFTAWGVSGFSASHDVASLWTSRDFIGTTIGLAWVGTVCTSFKYNVLEDFSSNAQLKRVLQAHELGHNFDASHNTGIMAPSVSSATNWSNTSITEIQNYYNGVSCLSNCPGSNAPSANFTYQLNNNCSPAEVEFTNLSTNATSWIWTFDGGTPSTSTAQNPIVSYTDGGTHNVTLEAINGSQSNSVTIPIFVNLVNDPIADFVFNVNGLLVNFINTGSGATSYNWDFGDGGTSNAQNPTYTYAVNGIYNVTLVVNNSCGQHEVTYPVEINVVPFVNFSANVTNACQPQTITFTNLSSNATSYLWTFQGGTPATSTEVNPVVVYTNPGTFDVTLESTNSAGTNTNFKAGYITITPTASASFNFAVSGTQATFTNTSQNSNAVTWDFGDNTTSTETNPVHVYQNNGVYAVTQTVTNNCGTNASTQAVTIAIPPIPSFVTSSQGPICVNENVQFFNTSTFSPTSVLWTFEGGTPATSSDPNPIVAYNNAGVFDVTLVVTNANGSAQTYLQDYVIVGAKPSVSYTHIGDGLEVSFTQNITNGTNHIWNFGDGQTSSEVNPTHIYNTEGTYTVTLTDINNCGTTVFSQSIVVQLLPTVGFSANATVICMDGSVQFNNQSSPSVTGWLWTFEGGIPATSTLENPLVQYNTVGEYNVTLTVTNAVGQSTTTVSDYITVLTVPTSQFDGDIDSNILTLTNTGLGSQTSSWSVFDTTLNVQLTGNQVEFVAPSNGIYNVILTNTNICGQAISDTFQFAINAYPNAIFTVNNGNATCNNAPTTFMANPASGATYQWTFVGGIPSSSLEQNPSVTYTSTGTYNVQLIITNNLGTDTINSTVSIMTLPISDFEASVNNNQVAFTFTGVGQISQYWDFGDGNTSIDINPTHTYNSSGSYAIHLITQNGCGYDTLRKEISIIISSANDTDNDALVSVQPNPSSGSFGLVIQGSLVGIYDLTVADISGKVLIKKNISITGFYTEDLDLQAFNNGIYLLTLKGQKLSKTLKLIVTK
jgi:PKD repeat protein